MTRPPRYAIDVDKQFPTLPNAPIVEAVIQINATPTNQIEPPGLSIVREISVATFQEIV